MRDSRPWREPPLYKAAAAPAGGPVASLAAALLGRGPGASLLEQLGAGQEEAVAAASAASGAASSPS